MMKRFYAGAVQNPETIHKAYQSLADDPQGIINGVEGACSYRAQELAFLLENGTFDRNNYDIKKDAVTGVNGITNHYWLRQMYAETKIVDGIINQGVTQVVIPATGLDTLGEFIARAFPNVQVFISDLKPMTDQRKAIVETDDFKARFGEKPANLHYDYVDLYKKYGEPETNGCISLKDALINNPDFKNDGKTVYLFQGISMYVTKEVFQNLFRDMHEATPNHAVIMGIIGGKKGKEFVPEGEREFVGKETYTDMLLSANETRNFFDACGYRTLEGVTPAKMKQGYNNWSDIIDDYRRKNPGSNPSFAEIKQAYRNASENKMVDMDTVIQNFLKVNPQANPELIRKAYETYADNHEAHYTFVTKSSDLTFTQVKIHEEALSGMRNLFSDDAMKPQSPGKYPEIKVQEGETFSPGFLKRILSRGR